MNDSLKKLPEEDIEQIEIILDLQTENITEAHMQQYLQILYEWYKKRIEYND